MKKPIIYLDVCCLNRPFDTAEQPRIRREANAVTDILARCDRGAWLHVSSAMAILEIDAIANDELRDRVRALLPAAELVRTFTTAIQSRAAELTSLGFKGADALHVAAAEDWHADVLLSCDDGLCRVGKRYAAQLAIQIANPCHWLEKLDHGAKR